MAARFTYSRWDGTQRGFDLDAEGLFDELTDDLLYHGDVNSALRRMMQEGMRDRNGERLQGLRELMDKLRQQRQEEQRLGLLPPVLQRPHHPEHPARQRQQPVRRPFVRRLHHPLEVGGRLVAVADADQQLGEPHPLLEPDDPILHS